MTLRVGVVISTEHAGGGEQYLLRLYSGLAGDGRVEPLLLGRLDGWSAVGLESVDIGLGGKWSFKSLGRVVRSLLPERRTALRRIRAEHERQPFDVFHLQYKREQLLLSRALSRLAPVVWTEHGRLPAGLKGRLVRPVYRWASRRVATVICVSGEVEGDVRAACGSGANTVVSQTAVDETVFRPAQGDERRALRERYGIPDGDVVVSAVVRLHPDKRVDRALRLVEPGCGRTLLVAGDGPDADRLGRLAHGLPVTFLGWIDDVSSVHRVSDISVQPFSIRGEGSPTSVVEAALSGCVLVGFSEDAASAEVAEAGGVVLDAVQTLDDTDVMATLERRREQALSWAAGRRLGPWLDAHFNVLKAAASRS